MNAHVDFDRHERKATLQMVAQRMVATQSDTSWMDVVGGCDDCSTIPFDAVAAGRTRSLELDGDRLVMRDDSFGSILD
jgi:hypothetical protein